jgi:hypothetical protein
MMLDDYAEELMARAIEMGLAGDGVMVRACLAKSLGTRRGQPLVLDDVGDFPEVTGPGDLSAAAAAITRALAEGRTTPEEAVQLSGMLHGFRPAFAAGAETSAGDPQKDVEKMREEIKRRLERIAAVQALEAEEEAAERAKAGDAEAEAMAAGWAGAAVAEEA